MSRCLLFALAAAAASACAPPPKLAAWHPEALLDAPDAAAALSASPPTVSHGDTITVNVTSIPASATKKCFVAAFLVGDNFTFTAPLEYYNIPCAAPLLLTFRAFNARAPWVFVLGDKGVATPRVLARSDPVAFRDVASPRAVRLTPMAAPGALRVAWTSPKPPSSAPRALLRPLSGGGANTTFPADTLRLRESDYCGGAATGAGYRDSGYFHTAVLTGLAPGARYVYSVGDDADGSAEFQLTGPPVAGSPGFFPFLLLAVGDMGQDTPDGAAEQDTFPPAPNTTRLMALDVAGPRQAGGVLHCGDVSYARGYVSEWEIFHASLDSIASRVPYGTNLGNHERDWSQSTVPSDSIWGNGTDSGGECGVATAFRFLMPVPTGANGATPLAAATNTSALFWAAATGPILQVHFSSELDFAPGSPAHDFLRDTLRGVDRAATPWVIVSTHRPIYISSTNTDPINGDQTVAALLRKHVEPLLMDAGGAPVDLVLYGHHHSYQRLSAVFNETVVTASVEEGGVAVYRAPRAPVHFVIGTGGAGFSTNTEAAPPPYFEKVAFVHGYARITALNASALAWELVNDVDGSVFDAALLLK